MPSLCLCDDRRRRRRHRSRDRTVNNIISHREQCELLLSNLFRYVFVAAFFHHLVHPFAVKTKLPYISQRNGQGSSYKST